jgi:hypothetical protein
VDSKNTAALTYGPEYMLGKFANLPDKPGDSKAAEEFQERFGSLFPGLDLKDFCVDVAAFRKAWHAKGAVEREAVGLYLANLFNRTFQFHVKPVTPSDGWKRILAGDARYFPAVKVDFSSGKIGLAPSATLLDWLAISLLDCRHRLGICERDGCATPYFVKMHPRARYCSEDCFRQSRLEKKNQWWKLNRGKDAKHSARNRAAIVKAKKSAKRRRR